MGPANFSDDAKSRYSDAHARCAWDVQAGNADICVGQIMETAELRALSSFSSALAWEDFVLVSMRQKDERTLESIGEVVAPLAWDTWIFVGVSLAMGGLVMWILEQGVATGDFPPAVPAGKAQEQETHGRRDGGSAAWVGRCNVIVSHFAASVAQIATSIWISLVGFLAKTTSHRVSSPGGRAAVLGLSWLSFFVTSAYIAHRAARLAQRATPAPARVPSILSMRDRASTERLCVSEKLAGVAEGRLGVPPTSLRLIEAASTLQDAGGARGRGEERVGGDAVGEGIVMMETMRRGGCAAALMPLKTARAVARAQVGRAVVCGDALSISARRGAAVKGMTLECSALLARSRVNANVSNASAAPTNISLDGTHRHRYCSMALVRDESVASVSLPVGLPVAVELEPFVTTAIKILRRSGRLAFPGRASLPVDGRGGGLENLTSACPLHNWWDLQSMTPWQEWRPQGVPRSQPGWVVLGWDTVAFLSALNGLMVVYVVALFFMVVGLVLACAQAIIALIAKCTESCKSPCCGGARSKALPDQLDSEPGSPKESTRDQWPAETLEEVGAIKVRVAM